MSSRCYDRISRHGLTQVYHPPEGGGGRAVAHIVFVHGLFGHPEKTWTGVKRASKVSQRASVSQNLNVNQNGGSSILQPPGSDLDSVFWPAALLPKVVPDAKIWTWGYDADIDGFWSSASRNTVSQHATNLLADVADLLESKDCRLPLIFIVHSLGGLIVKAALNISSGTKANRFKIVAPLVHGILFLGTPHRGSKSASIGKVAYQITKAAARRPNEKLLQALEKNSDTLDQINNDFLQTLEEHKNIAIASFREEKETRKYLIFSTTVVEADSARIGLAREELNSIPENHRNMAKLSSTEDVGFKRVSAQVQRWIQLLSLPLHESDKEEYIECVRSLHSLTTKARLKNVTASHSETLKWLFDINVVNFSSWLQDSQNDLGPIYWIQGKPGSGKSTLMKFAMMDPKLLNILETSESIPYVIAGFFFHDRGSIIQKSISGMLQELLHSILVKSPPLRQFVNPIYTNLVENQQTQLPAWDLESLQSAFEAIIKQRQVSTRLCLFLDALDEHQGDNEYLAILMKKLVALADGTVVKIKMCLASRPWDTFVTSFGKCPGFKIHDHTYNDIEAYTLSEFNRSSSTEVEITSQKDARSAKLAALAVQVTIKARGVFIWVRIVVEEICKGLRDRTPLFVLEERLAKIPEELKDLYQHTLERVEPDHVEESYVMLQVALCALSPLGLRTFVNTTTHAVWAKIPESDTESVEDMIQRIVSRSGGLLEITELAPVEISINQDSETTEISAIERQTEVNETPRQDAGSRSLKDEHLNVVHQVQFIHQTVKEYIQGRADNFGLKRTQTGGTGYHYILAAAVARENIQEWADEITVDLYEYARLANQSKDEASQHTLRASLDVLSEGKIFWWLNKNNSDFYIFVCTHLSEGREPILYSSVARAALALAAGLFEYVNENISANQSFSNKEELIVTALLGPKVTSVQISRREMLNLLFQNDISPQTPISAQYLPHLDNDNNRIFSPLELILREKGQYDQDETERVSAMACLLDHGADPNATFVWSEGGLTITMSAFELCIRQESVEVVRLFGQYGTTLSPVMFLPIVILWQMISSPSEVLKEVIELYKRDNPTIDFKDYSNQIQSHHSSNGWARTLFWDTITSTAAPMQGAVAALSIGMSSMFKRHARRELISAEALKRAILAPDVGRGWYDSPNDV